MSEVDRRATVNGSRGATELWFPDATVAMINNCLAGKVRIAHLDLAVDSKITALLHFPTIGRPEVSPIVCTELTLLLFFMSDKSHSVAEGIAVGGHAGKAIIIGPCLYAIDKPACAIPFCCRDR